MKTLILLIHTFVPVIFLLFFFQTTNAQWVRNTFSEGGNASVICIDSSGVIYVGTNTGEIFKSTNQGTNWINSSNGLNKKQINSIAAGINYVIAATTGKGIVKSTNQGSSWFLSNSGLPDVDLYTISIHGNSIYTAYATVYKSTNNCASWNYSGSGIESNHGVNDIACIDNFCYTATRLGASGTMYKSSNYGANWIINNNGLPNSYVKQFAVNGSNIYGLINNGSIYKSTNFGENWFNYNAFSSNTNSINSFNNFIAAGEGANFHFSTNNGDTWINYINVLPSNTTNNILIQNSYLICATSRGLFKSTNSGANWNSINNGFYNISVNTLLGLQNFVLLGTNSFGMYKTTNNGVNWYNVSGIPNYVSISKLKYYNNMIYCLISSRINKSNDNGENWVIVPVQGNTDINNYEIKDNFMFANSTTGIYFSTTGGLDWMNVTSGLPFVLQNVSAYYIMDTCALLSIIAGYPFNATGIYRFSFSNYSWQLVSNSGLPGRIYNFYKYSSRVFAAAIDSGIFVSTNNGLNWIRKSNGLPYPEQVTDFTLSGDTFYICTAQNGIYISTNNANNWLPFNDGLDSTRSFRSITAGINMLFTGGIYGLYKRTAFVNKSNEQISVPVEFSLMQNYPNPFNPASKIRFDIPYVSLKQDVNVKIIAYDVIGREICVLVNDMLKPGNYEVQFIGSNFASGIYFYKMTCFDASGNTVFTATKKMLLVK